VRCSTTPVINGNVARKHRKFDVRCKIADVRAIDSRHLAASFSS
jgi:hypothetical protein